MRNLKRALSLALATVMTLGLMVVGTGAVGYDDVADTDNVEAIEVLQAVGIMTGDENGNFNPDNLVTRNEMAVVMSQLLNLNYNYYRGTNPFTDVPAWAAPYVAACAAEGVTSGIGDGLYGGDQNVTAAQAALMILKALGYFQYQADFEGDWQVTTIRQASYINLFDNIDASAEEALTRNQIAQLVLNGLKSNLVEFTGNVGATVGDVVIGHNTQYTARTNAANKYNTIDVGTTNIAANDQYYIQLGEELYDGDLELKNNAEDDFARPSRQWIYNGDEIGTYVKNELLVEEYTTEITGRDLYDALGRAAIEDNFVDYYLNGREDDTIEATNMIRSNTRDYSTTGNGVLTQVFFDRNEEQITITSIDTYLANVEDDFDEDDGVLPVEIHANAPEGLDDEISEDEVPGVSAYQDGDKILVQVAWDGRNYNIVNAMAPEVLSDVTLTRYSENNYVGNGSEQYDYSLNGHRTMGALDKIAEYSNNALTDYTYDLYLDQYGYLVGNVAHGGSDEYVFITGYDYRTSNLANSTATANAIFLDGTMEPIQVNVRETQENIDEYNKTVGTKYGAADASDSHINGGYRDFDTDTGDGVYESEYNSWFTYTTETVGNNTVYTLEPVANWMDVQYADDDEINSASVRLDSTIGSLGLTRAYGNDDSVFITVDTDYVSGSTHAAISEINGVYTGVQDVDIKITPYTDDDYNLIATNKGVGQDAAGNWTVNGSTSTGHASCATRSSVFAVYDKDQYIIGAVIIGDNGGANQNYIYVLDDIKNERVEGGDYFWEVDVAQDGEVRTLTIKTSAADFRTIRNNIQNAMNTVTGTPDVATAVNGMLKLTYDADGYVIKAEPVNALNGLTDAIYGNDDAEAAQDIEPDDESIYLVQYDASAPTGHVLGAVDFTVQGRTLYTSYANDQGVTIETGAPVIVIQPYVDSEGNIEYDYDVFTGDNALKRAIDSLEESAYFQGWVAAALNGKGTAEHLVISSEIPKDVITSGGPTHGSDYEVANIAAYQFPSDSKYGIEVTLNTNVRTDDEVTMKVYTQNKDSGSGYGRIGIETPIAEGTDSYRVLSDLAADIGYRLAKGTYNVYVVLTVNGEQMEASEVFEVVIP